MAVGAVESNSVIMTILIGLSLRTESSGKPSHYATLDPLLYARRLRELLSSLDLDNDSDVLAEPVRT
jgi:hypothetical protein